MRFDIYEQRGGGGKGEQRFVVLQSVAMIFLYECTDITAYRDYIVPM